MGSDGGAWAMDPATALTTSFVPQGIGADLIATLEGFSREDVDAFAAESQARAAKAQANGYFDRSVVPVKDINGLTVLEKDEFIRPGTTVESLAGLKPSFAQIGDQGGFDSVALEKYHWVDEIDHVHHAGNSSGIVDGASLVAIGTEQVGTDLGLTAAGPDPGHGRVRRRPDDHAHRPRPGLPQGAGQGRAGALRTSTSTRSTRPSPRWRCGSCATSTCRTRRSTSTAARSRWATRSARPAR